MCRYKYYISIYIYILKNNSETRNNPRSRSDILDSCPYRCHHLQLQRLRNIFSWGKCEGALFGFTSSWMGCICWMLVIHLWPQKNGKNLRLTSYRMRTHRRFVILLGNIQAGSNVLNVNQFQAVANSCIFVGSSSAPVSHAVHKICLCACSHRLQKDRQAID